MRLFLALLPPEPVLDSLTAELARHRELVPPDNGLRWISPERWHITLAFYGEDDLHARAAWLARVLAGCAAPRLWLAGAGRFTGVLWVGVSATRPAELGGLGAATRTSTDDKPFHPHLTVARGKPPGGFGPWLALLDGYVSPGWTATEAVLMRSRTDRDGPRYTPLERYPLSLDGCGHEQA